MQYVKDFRNTYLLQEFILYYFSEEEKKYIQNAINDIYAMIKDKNQVLSKNTFIENTGKIIRYKNLFKT